MLNSEAVSRFVAEKPVIESKHQLLHGRRSSFICGELRAGGIAYVYVCLERSYDLSAGHAGQHAYTFGIHIVSESLSSVSIFSVCCYSSVSIWVVS